MTPFMGLSRVLKHPFNLAPKGIHGLKIFMLILSLLYVHIPRYDSEYCTISVSVRYISTMLAFHVFGSGIDLDFCFREGLFYHLRILLRQIESN